MRILPFVIIILIIVALVIYLDNQPLQQEATTGQESGTQPAVSQGTVPGRSPLHAGDLAMPTTAIDTNELPELVIPADNDDADKPLPVYQLAPDTYMFFGNVSQLDLQNRGANANAGFVITNAGVVVIDTLGTPRLGRRLISTIRAMTDQPITHLIITHNHPDHAYGAVAFADLEGVTIIGHRGVVDYIGSQINEESVNHRREMLPEDMRGFDTVRPDVLIGAERFSSQQITVGDRTFVLYNTGAHHSYGDLVIHQVEDNIVWISDLAFNQRLTYVGDGNSQQIIEGLDWLLKSFGSAVLMVPGHGSAQTVPFPMVVKTRDYVQRLRDLMAKAVEDDVDMYDAVKQTEFPDWRDTRLYEENHGRNVQFVYREMELLLF